VQQRIEVSTGHFKHLGRLVRTCARRALPIAVEEAYLAHVLAWAAQPNQALFRRPQRLDDLHLARRDDVEAVAILPLPKEERAGRKRAGAQRSGEMLYLVVRQRYEKRDLLDNGF
jgi:hypothetical protein